MGGGDEWSKVKFKGQGIRLNIYVLMFNMYLECLLFLSLLFLSQIMSLLRIRVFIKYDTYN